MAAVALLLLLCAAPGSAPAPSKAPPPLPDPRQRWPPDAGPRPPWADRPGRNPRLDNRGWRSDQDRKKKRADEREAIEAAALAAIHDAILSDDIFSIMAADAEAAGWGPILEVVVEAVNANDADPWRQLSTAVLRQIIAAAAAARDTGGPASKAAEVAATFAATAAAASAASANRDLSDEVIQSMSDWHRGRSISGVFHDGRVLENAGMHSTSHSTDWQTCIAAAITASGPDIGTASASGPDSGTGPATASASASAEPSQASPSMQALLELQADSGTGTATACKSSVQPPWRASSSKRRKEVGLTETVVKKESEAEATYSRTSDAASSSGTNLLKPSAVAGRSKTWRKGRPPN